MRGEEEEGVGEIGFRVDEILNTRVDPETKLVFYYVRWEGYGDEQNTWEWREDLLNDGHGWAIQEFTLRESQRTSSTTARARDRTPEPMSRRSRENYSAQAASPPDTATSRRSTPSKSRRVLALLQQEDSQEEEEENEEVRPQDVDIARYVAKEEAALVARKPSKTILFFLLACALGGELAATVAADWHPQGQALAQALDLCWLLCTILLLSFDHALTKGTAIVGTAAWIASITEVKQPKLLDLTTYCAYLACALAMDKLVELRSLRALGNTLAALFALAYVYSDPVWKLASAGVMVLSSLLF